MPMWVLGICVAAFVVVVFFLPANVAKAVVDVVISSDQAKLIAAAAGLIGFAVVVVTAYQIKIDLEDRADERVQRKADAIERQWTRLLAPAVGNTGKGEALTNLLKADIAVDGVDISCLAIGGWDEKTPHCRRRAILTGVVIQPTIPDFKLGSDRYQGVTETNNIDLSWAIMKAPKIVSHIFQDLVLDGVAISDADIVNSAFDFRAQGLDIRGSRILNSILETTDYMRISTTEISGSLIQGLDKQDVTDLNTLTAWADAPPTHRVTIDATASTPQLTRTEPWGPDILGAIFLCVPPKGTDGSLIPIYQRRRIQNLGGFFPTCRRMQPDEALKAFPSSYTQTDWSFTAFRGRVQLRKAMIGIFSGGG